MVILWLCYCVIRRKKNANKYLEIDRIITTQCLKEADKELTKDFANEYLEKFEY